MQQQKVSDLRNQLSDINDLQLRVKQLKDANDILIDKEEQAQKSKSTEGSRIQELEFEVSSFNQQLSQIKTDCEQKVQIFENQVAILKTSLSDLTKLRDEEAAILSSTKERERQLVQTFTEEKE